MPEAKTEVLCPADRLDEEEDWCRPIVSSFAFWSYKCQDSRERLASYSSSWRLVHNEDPIYDDTRSLNNDGLIVNMPGYVRINVNIS